MFLNDTWKLWFHDPNNEAWDDKSYVELATMSTLEDVVQVCDAFKDLWNKGMFFAMREHIKPTWEDEHNASGGCFSYKANKPEVSRAWFELLSLACGETLVVADKRADNWEKVCGVSISPKRTYCILRIWVADAAWGNPDYYTIHPPSLMFKTH